MTADAPAAPARPGRGNAPTAVVRAVGTCLPAAVVSNEEVIARGLLDTSDEWITSRTGIRRRRHAPAGVGAGDLAVAAARAALAALPGTDPPDLLLLATTTPDRPCPATAPETAHRLGLGPVPAFDLAAVCSGFLYGLVTAAALLRAGVCRSALLVAAEKYTAIIDPFDRDTAPLFGDGAAAVVLGRGTADEPGAIQATDWGSDGSGSDLIAVAAGGSRSPLTDGRTPGRDARCFRMRGSQVYARAVRAMTASSRAVLDATGWSSADVRAFIGHQANQRILDSVADRLGIAPEHCLGNIGDVGNTAAASIPLALADALAAGQGPPPGRPTLLTAFGGGLTWASATLRWPDAPVRSAPAPEPRPSNPSAPS